MHEYDIKAKNNKSLKDYLKYNCLPIPKHWQENENMTIFD